MKTRQTSGTGRRRLRLPSLSLENDIRYRGPFSYQHFQIFGWICIVLTFVVLMMNTGSRINPELEPRFKRWKDILEYVTDLSLPLLLIANFAIILDNSNGYRNQLLRNGAATLGFALAFYLLYDKYLLGVVRNIVDAPEQAEPFVADLIRKSGRSGFLAFNLFMDLFLCTCVMFFLNYRPGRLFTGKARVIFRLFALLPIAYEAGCIYLKIMSSMGRFVIPVNWYPWLTVKPPVTFALFVVLAVFIKTRELRFRRHGGTHEDYRKFLLTRRNSLHFSAFAAVAMLIAGFVDLMILLHAPEALSGGDAEQMVQVVMALLAAGFGGSIILALLAPVMLLFSYTRRPRLPILSILIPVVGYVLIVLVLVQGAYQIFRTLDLPRLNMAELSQGLQEMTEAM